MSVQAIYYGIIFVCSFVLLTLFLVSWHRHLDVHMTICFVLIPIVDLCYYIMYSVTDARAAVVALKMVYAGGCFLPWVITMCIASLCGIELNKRVRIGSFFVSFALYAMVLTIGKSDVFYKSIEIVNDGGRTVFQKEYGFGHTVYYIAIILYLIAEITLILYSYYKKMQVSRATLFFLFLPIPVTLAGYIANHYTMKLGFEIVPLTYVMAQVIYLIIVHRMAIYKIGEMAAESLLESGNTGFISVDSKRRYIGSNGTAKNILPDLLKLRVDGRSDLTDTLKNTLAHWIDEFEKENREKTVCTVPGGNGEGEKYYSVAVEYLTDGRKRRGYQILLEDDTKNQEYIRFVDNYNSALKKEVESKTARIVEMHDKLILGMATMVESRDNSTGGHIRRTSEGVRILIEEMKKDDMPGLDGGFCKNIIKAAPMHDLGKIAVDDAILRKPGRYTPGEREIMKSHAAEGARIVHEILKDTEDEDFRRIAENVAHYHHEKVDGSGYPDGLTLEAIPLEARIMAIADVYDALVSKRVYKERFSFEEADRIILEGMGNHFDPALRKYYEKARPRLEEFYSKEQ